MTGKRLIAWLCGAIPKESRPLVAFMFVAGAALFGIRFLSASWAEFLAYLIGGGTVILLANRRATAMENNVRVAEKGQTISRFKDAVEMLKSQNSSILVGAIYALHQIAEEKKGLQDAVFGVLCEFVREPVSQSGRETARQIAVNALFSPGGENIYRGLKPLLKDANFHGLILSGLNMSAADLSGAIFGKVDAHGVNLSGAKLKGAQSSENVNLREANLANADLRESILTNVHFEGSDFADTKTDKADFSESFFGGVLNLTYDQLKVVKSLRDARGLPEDLKKRLQRDKPEIFA